MGYKKWESAGLQPKAVRIWWGEGLTFVWFWGAPHPRYLQFCLDFLVLLLGI